MVKNRLFPVWTLSVKVEEGNPARASLTTPATRYPLPAARYPQRHNRLCFSGQRAAGSGRRVT